MQQYLDWNLLFHVKFDTLLAKQSLNLVSFPVIKKKKCMQKPPFAAADKTPHAKISIRMFKIKS